MKTIDNRDLQTNFLFHWRKKLKSWTFSQCSISIPQAYNIEVTHNKVHSNLTDRQTDNPKLGNSVIHFKTIGPRRLYHINPTGQRWAQVIVVIHGGDFQEEQGAIQLVSPHFLHGRQDPWHKKSPSIRSVSICTSTFDLLVQVPASES